MDNNHEPVDSIGIMLAWILGAAWAGGAFGKAGFFVYMFISAVVFGVAKLSEHQVDETDEKWWDRQ